MNKMKIGDVVAIDDKEDLFADKYGVLIDIIDADCYFHVFGIDKNLDHRYVEECELEEIVMK